MSDHFKFIYKHDAVRYDALVRSEDYQGNLLPALQAICRLEGLTVVELGAGTGRLTRLMAPLVSKIYAFDISPAMLQIAQESLDDYGSNWRMVVADNRQLPIKGHAADLIVVGWSIGHFVGWYPDSWREEMAQILSEMFRVVEKGCTVIIVETMGTGSDIPVPPHEGLATYYHMLESKYDFRHTWIRTDMKFESISQADELLRFFFQDEHTNHMLKAHSLIIPECTGIWWKPT